MQDVTMTITQIEDTEYVNISQRYCKDTIIRGEPEQAPNTRETGSSVLYIIIYLFIYLCVVLHGNDLMRMLNHHLLERDW